MGILLVQPRGLALYLQAKPETRTWVQVVYLGVTQEAGGGGREKEGYGISVLLGFLEQRSEDPPEGSAWRQEDGAASYQLLPLLVKNYPW